MSRKLSEKQREIVEYKHVAICVKASAGSGKTRVLTERIRFLLKDSNKKVLALTFTNKAGEEIRERLKEIEGIKEKTIIGTFHSFCQSIIENHGNLIGYSNMPHIFESQNDRLELIGQAIEKVQGLKEHYLEISDKEQKKLKYKALEFVSTVKRELFDKDELYIELKDENSRILFDSYKEILTEQNAIDFDDLILLANELLSSNPRIAKLYRRSFIGICIDESQDLNKAQYKFLKTLTNGEFNNIMMVGDPNQSIFGFNGSSSRYMIEEFPKDFEAKKFELVENYRSSKKILKNANKIINTKSDVSNVAKEGIFEFNSLKNEENEAIWVVDKIKELLKLVNHDDIEGEITEEKIAVIARNKYIFNSLQNEFKKENINYNFKSSLGAPKFESELMNLFILALTVKLNERDSLHKEKLFKILKLKNNNLELKTILLNLKNSNHKEIIKQVLNLKEDGSNLNKILLELKKSFDNLQDEEKNLVFNDIEEFKNHWKIYAIKTDKKLLSKFKMDMALGKTNPLTKQSGITLSTVHTMKGQEYDIVFIIGLDDGTFPDYRALKGNELELKQEKNNLYVAFTRARRFLYVTYPKERKMPWGDTMKRNKSSFLKEIKENDNNK